MHERRCSSFFPSKGGRFSLEYIFDGFVNSTRRMFMLWVLWVDAVSTIVIPPWTAIMPFFYELLHTHFFPVLSFNMNSSVFFHNSIQQRFTSSPSSCWNLIGMKIHIEKLIFWKWKQSWFFSNFELIFTSSYISEKPNKNLDHKHTLLSLYTWAAFAEILSTGFFPETIKIRPRYCQTSSIPNFSGQPKKPKLWRWVQPCQRRRWWGCVCLSTATALVTIVGWTCCSR